MSFRCGVGEGQYTPYNGGQAEKCGGYTSSV